MVNEFCRECPKCGRVFECDDDDYSSKKKIGEEVPLRLHMTNFYLKNVFRKWNIDEMFSSSEGSIFLVTLLLNFKDVTGKDSELLLFSVQLF